MAVEHIPDLPHGAPAGRGPGCNELVGASGAALTELVIIGVADPVDLRAVMGATRPHATRPSGQQMRRNLSPTNYTCEIQWSQR